MRLTIDMALDQYVNEHVVHNVIDYDRILLHVKHLKSFFKPRETIKKVGIPEAREYIIFRRKEGAEPATIRSELMCLKTAARHAVKWKRLSVDHLPQLELPPQSEPKLRWLTESELDSLRAGATNPRVRLFIEIAYYTAARRSAVENLTWSQVNFYENRIYLNPEGRAQTKKRRPVVPIDNKLLPFLLEAYKTRASNQEYVLGSNGAIWTVFQAAVNAAKLTDVSPHTLRHSRATHLLQKGVSMWFVANLLGDTVATVQKTYAHYCPDFLRDVLSAPPVAEPSTVDIP